MGLRLSINNVDPFLGIMVTDPVFHSSGIWPLLKENTKKSDRTKGRILKISFNREVFKSEMPEDLFVFILLISE